MTQIASSQDIRDPETYAIIGAAMEMHKNLGAGFLEPVYHAALGLELRARNIPHVREREIPVYYKGNSLDIAYRADFICFGEVLVELKALGRLTEVHNAQVINYLVATRFARGILLNFGSASLQYKRFAGPRACRVQSAESAKSVDRS